MLSFVIAASSVFAAVGKPFNLRVAEGFENPLGYNLENMSFSWMLPQGENVRQRAYRIQVVADVEHFGLSDADLDRMAVWDSGKVESGQSVKIPYSPKCKPVTGERLYWRVKYWDNAGAESEWSDVDFFEYGNFDADFVSGASFISGGFPETKNYVLKISRKNSLAKAKREVKPLYFRKPFALSKKVKKARLYVSSLGVFQAYINGKKVGDDFWGTGWTDYNKRVQANAYDVTEMLSDGGNVVAATLGDGWYAGMIGLRHRGVYGDVPAIQMRLDVEYVDGMREKISTDASWRWSYGAIQYSDIYMGEVYDARLEADGWNCVGFDDSKWLSAVLVDGLKAKVEPRRSAPIRIVERIAPKSAVKIADKTYIFDMGQNMVGWVDVNLRIPEGRKITLRYAEMLQKDGTMYTENYRSAASRDQIIGRGGKLRWSPSFTFHGFRYVEVSGLDYQPKPEDVIGVVLHSDIARTGGFECSDEMLNKLQSCIIWGQKSNFLSVPTDCPQRDERLGWMGDAVVFSPTATFNMDTDAFYSKWLVDVIDTQRDNGIFGFIAPDILNAANGAPVWGDAAILIPWDVYMAYGNRRILENSYAAMVKWLDYQTKSSPEYIRENKGFGDWLQPNGKSIKGDASNSLIGTAYFAHGAEVVSKIAEILGKKDDAKKYAELSENVKKAFVKRFVGADGTVESDSQTAYLLPLAFDILPRELARKAHAKLLERIAKDNFHLNTGFVGTPHLNPVLTKTGSHGLAVRLLLNKTYPSWLYPITQGATTMWERWNSFSHEKGFGDVNMNSFNHYAYGAIGQWMYANIGGLWYDAAGYSRVLFAPKFDKRITSASVWHETPYGRASSAWRLENGAVKWRVTVPSNSDGRVVFDTKKPDSIRVNGKSAKLETSPDGYPQTVLPSGEYTLEFKL